MTRLVAAIFFALLTLAGCGDPNDKTFQGWVEANLVFVGPDEVGRIETLSVREGDAVTVGAPLFTLDRDLQEADVLQNKATLTNARQAFDRADQLLKSKVGTQMAYDVAQAALREAEAKLNSSETRLTRRRVFSPVTGTVQQIYFRPGEMVSAGRPVVALLPPGNVKIRFFVPETKLAQIAIGDRIAVQCDGCKNDLVARVSFISRTSEYTPPVIYSLEERSKLVFLIEALPERPEDFRVGQPLTVELMPREAAP